MNAQPNFDRFSIEDGIIIASRIAGINWNVSMETVFRIALSQFANMPTLRMRGQGQIEFSDYVGRWALAYVNGFKNRPSQRISSLSTTIPDPIIKIILGARFPNLSGQQLDLIENGHSAMMTIENLVGDFLEEYLSIRLENLGWCCAWGSTIDAVDFCKLDGSLLQVKNSDNSENSSSSQVRRGRPIQKWFRRFSQRKESFNWDKLSKMVGEVDVSEEDFRSFVSTTISNNPNSIVVPPTFFGNT